MSANTPATAQAGSVFGLPLPDEARLHVGVHQLTGESFDRLVREALAAGLPVERDENNGTRWVVIGVASFKVTLFAPDGHDLESGFDEAINRKLAEVKFIEFPRPQRPVLPPAVPADAGSLARQIGLVDEHGRLTKRAFDGLDQRIAADQAHDRTRR
jgi:hypothetical protein